MLVIFLLLTLSISTIYGDGLYRDEDCVRLRKPFHTLSEDDRLLYVSGYQTLRQNGKLEQISNAHAANVAVHKGSSFFFLHAYMIWEAETAIRELGGKYECFSMPYWDYTIDSGLEKDPTIFHLNVGANGNNQNMFCMDDPLWGVDNYWSTDTDTCMNGETRDPPRCCLKRSVSDTQLLPNTMQIAAAFVNNNNFLLFETQMTHYHTWPHFYLAVNTWSQMATAYAVDDPIFFLLHTFTLYQRALWTTCYEYDKIDISELHHYPNAYTPSCNPNALDNDCGVVGIDAVYNLYPLNEQNWTLASKMDITPRMFYDISDWNIQYDLGDFYTRSKLNEWCEYNAIHNDVIGPNPNWFVDETETYVFEKRENKLQEFIDDKWNELKSQQNELGLSNNEMYSAVESLSCKYHRIKSENSCYDINDNIINNNEYETCKSKNIIYKNDITLNDMLQFNGVRENECLIKRRTQLYSVIGLDDSIKIPLCNGEFDYKCPDWQYEEHYLLKNNLLSLQLISSYNITLTSICILVVFCIYFLIHSFCIRRIKRKKPNNQYDIEYGTF